MEGSSQKSVLGSGNGNANENYNPRQPAFQQPPLPNNQNSMGGHQMSSGGMLPFIPAFQAFPAHVFANTVNEQVMGCTSNAASQYFSQGGGQRSCVQRPAKLEFAPQRPATQAAVTISAEAAEIKAKLLNQRERPKSGANVPVLNQKDSKNTAKDVSSIGNIPNTSDESTGKCSSTAISEDPIDDLLASVQAGIDSDWERNSALPASKQKSTGQTLDTTTNRHSLPSTNKHEKENISPSLYVPPELSEGEIDETSLPASITFAPIPEINSSDITRVDPEMDGIRAPQEIKIENDRATLQSLRPQDKRAENTQITTCEQDQEQGQNKQVSNVNQAETPRVHGSMGRHHDIYRPGKSRNFQEHQTSIRGAAKDSEDQKRLPSNDEDSMRNNTANENSKKAVPAEHEWKLSEAETDEDLRDFLEFTHWNDVGQRSKVLKKGRRVRALQIIDAQRAALLAEDLEEEETPLKMSAPTTATITLAPPGQRKVTAVPEKPRAMIESQRAGTKRRYSDISGPNGRDSLDRTDARDYHKLKREHDNDNGRLLPSNSFRDVHRSSTHEICRGGRHDNYPNKGRRGESDHRLSSAYDAFLARDPMRSTMNSPPRRGYESYRPSDDDYRRDYYLSHERGGFARSDFGRRQRGSLESRIEPRSRPSNEQAPRGEPPKDSKPMKNGHRGGKSSRKHTR